GGGRDREARRCRWRRLLGGSFVMRVGCALPRFVVRSHRNELAVIPAQAGIQRVATRVQRTESSAHSHSRADGNPERRKKSREALFVAVAKKGSSALSQLDFRIAAGC